MTLTVDHDPGHRHLVFWALQVEFGSVTGAVAGAHIGLQWNPRHPGMRAVNWGGYDRAGNVLSGSSSSLPSTPHDANTRDFGWVAGRPYRLAVRAGAQQGAWVGSVTDLTSGSEHVVRELFAGGDVARRPVVWSEVFARCDDPSVSATWSDPVAVSARGSAIPKAYRVSYQSQEAGGCSNTDVRVTAAGVRQMTAVRRQVPEGRLVALP